MQVLLVNKLHVSSPKGIKSKTTETKKKKKAKHNKLKMSHHDFDIKYKTLSSQYH